ncbi:MAG TPA: hypothetical protein VGF95_05910 [Solirubrobacteraceae bacterium]|jgi:hypothetical protein
MGFEEVRAGVVARLRGREAQDVELMFDRLRSDVPDHLGDENVAYTDGLRKAVAATLDYCLSAMEYGEDGAGSPPRAMLEQAHRAAQHGVPLGTVMRRCTEGERLLREIVAEETKELSAEVHAKVLHAPESAIKRLTADIAAAYEHAWRCAGNSVERRHEQTVRRLLAGAQTEDQHLAELGYKIHSRSHMAIIAVGAGAEAALDSLKTGYGHNALVISTDGEEVWGWLANQGTVTGDLECLLLHGGTPSLSAGVGGPHPGFAGFCRAHREAQEALLLALPRPNAVAYYPDHPLLAAVLRNASLQRTLKDLIAPLNDTHRRLLRAYISARCNASSAASAMRVDRHTVTRSVKEAEERTNRQVEKCLAEFDIALSLAEFERASADAAPSE